MNLEEVTLDGEHGWLAYFDESMRMVERDKAVMAKVVFDSGRIVFYTVSKA